MASLITRELEQDSADFGVVNFWTYLLGATLIVLALLALKPCS
jgi:hypothetical protein